MCAVEEVIFLGERRQGTKEGKREREISDRKFAIVATGREYCGRRQIVSGKLVKGGT